MVSLGIVPCFFGFLFFGWELYNAITHPLTDPHLQDAYSQMLLVYGGLAFLFGLLTLYFALKKSRKK